MELRQLYNGNANPGTISEEYLIPNHMTVIIQQYFNFNIYIYMLKKIY